MRRKIIVFAAAFLLILCVGLAAGDEKSYSGSDSCVECHEDTAKHFATNVHSRLRDFEVRGRAAGCEACHGPGSKHIESNEPVDIITFKGMSADQISKACLSCHKGEKMMEAAGNAHLLNDVSCVNCHDVHGSKMKYSLKASEYKLCSECHGDVKAEFGYPSHHPVKEGKITCSSCHNVHAVGNEDLATDERLNDLCFKCHSYLQGPFIFEHEPVVESCATCHEPHGTVANNLLAQSEPFLCLQCHEMHFHTTLIADSETEVVVGGKTVANPLGEKSYKIAFGTKCTQCHSKIHGTDLPSQSVPSRGKSMVR